MHRYFFIFYVVFMFLFLSCEQSSGSEKSKFEFRGADISHFIELDSLGASFYKDKEKTELLEILKNAGVNWIRLRIWNNHPNGKNSIDGSIDLAKKVKDYGFNLLINFHYSDNWTDPNQQTTPAAWQSLSFDRLCSEVEDFTAKGLEKFISAGCTPDMVQIGNEITNGMLWPMGKIGYDGECENLMKLIAAGSKGARKSCPSAKVILHLDAGAKKDRCLWWFSQAEKFSADYDIIGLSYYSYWGDKDIDAVAQNISALENKFKKPIIIAETNYPWTLGWDDSTTNIVGDASALIPEFAASVEGQKSYFYNFCKTVYNAGASGVFWWEPEAIAQTGFASDIENLGWFDFNSVYNGTGDVFLEFK